MLDVLGPWDPKKCCQIFCLLKFAELFPSRLQQCKSFKTQGCQLLESDLSRNLAGYRTVVAALGTGL